MDLPASLDPLEAKDTWDSEPLESKERRDCLVCLDLPARPDPSRGHLPLTRWKSCQDLMDQLE